VQVPFDGFAQQVRGVAPLGAGTFEVIVQRVAVFGVDAVVDDDPRAFTRREPTQVRQALFGHQDIHVVLGMVDVADHGHNAGNGAALGDRLGDEDGQVGVAGEIPRAADTIHHPGAADVGRVDVAVDIEL